LTSTLRLRVATTEDLQTASGWIDSPSDLLQWAGTAFTYPLDDDRIEAHLDATHGSSPARRAFAAVGDTGRIAGYVELDRIDRQNRSARVARVVVATERRGEGRATEMVRRVAERGFETLDLHRIGLRVFDFNEAVIACYENWGFTRDGTLRDARRTDDGAFWSLLVTSRLKPS
jgi:RimJ/RimL family protein N-acetyltransferase